MSVTWLIDRMRSWENEKAIIWRDSEFTYRDLLLSIDSWISELDTRGIQSGSVVAIEGDYSPRTCSLLFALMREFDT